MIYIYRRQTWLLIKKEFITQVLKSFIIFHQTLKIVVGEVENSFIMSFGEEQHERFEKWSTETTAASSLHCAVNTRTHSANTACI
jgi:hypothetical protein